jgi:hypothetical protein
MMPNSGTTTKVNAMMKMRGVIVKNEATAFSATKGRGGISWGETKAKSA